MVLDGKLTISVPPSNSAFLENIACDINLWTHNLENAGLWSRSRHLGLETYQRLISVSSWEKLSTSRSREADVSVASRSRPFTSCAQDSSLRVNGL